MAAGVDADIIVLHLHPVMSGVIFVECAAVLVRPVNVQIVKMMLEASIEQFFARDILIRNGLTYQEALDEVVRVIVDGIIVRPGKETA